MDEDLQNVKETLRDIKRCLVDALENEDWKCIEDAIDIISDIDGTYDDSLDEQFGD